MLANLHRPRLAAVLLALALFAPLPGSATAQDDPVQRLNRFLAETRTLRAEFRQTLYDEDMQLLEGASGVFLLARPGRFRWTYQRPYEQHIVGDGNRVWVHDVDLNQVTVGDFDAGMEASPALLLGTDRPLDDFFEVRGLERQGGLDRVLLLPRRHEESAFEFIRLALDAGGLRVMELGDAFGQLTRLVFENVLRNAPIDDSRFRFVPPDDADVVRR